MSHGSWTLSPLGLFFLTYNTRWFATSSTNRCTQILRSLSPELPSQSDCPITKRLQDGWLSQLTLTIVWSPSFSLDHHLYKHLPPSSYVLNYDGWKKKKKIEQSILESQACQLKWMRWLMSTTCFNEMGRRFWRKRRMVEKPFNRSHISIYVDERPHQSVGWTLIFRRFKKPLEPISGHQSFSRVLLTSRGPWLTYD